MKQHFISASAASFVLLAIVFGGSTQEAWPNLGLQLAGIALVAWAAIARREASVARSRVPYLLLLSALAVILIQLVPIPAGLWTKLPGRDFLTQGFRVLGYPPVPMALSESPYTSILTLFAAIPAIAGFVVTDRLGPGQRAIVGATLVGMLAAIFMGAIQVAGGPDSPAYFYKVHSSGAVGFFANHNHMATLLLMGIPLTIASAVTWATKGRSSAIFGYGVGAGVILLIAVGTVLTGSRAAIALAIPVLVASISLFPAAVRWRGTLLSVASVALIGGVVALSMIPISPGSVDMTGTPSGASRTHIWKTTAAAAIQNLPAGTGLGTFQEVYHRYEDPARVTGQYVNHAHNDYLEMALELGVAGVLLIALFLLWWVMAARRIWTSIYGTVFQRAATIATAAVLAHSFVDFPLRTAAIGTTFGLLIGLMSAGGPRAAGSPAGKSGSARHMEIV